MSRNNSTSDKPYSSCLVFDELQQYQATENLTPGEIKERRIPKKNRVQLLSTAEEEETPPSSPEKAVLSSSPPHESKVRMIRERVRGINWEDSTMQENGDAESREATEADEAAALSVTPPEEADDKEVNGEHSDEKADSEEEEGKALGLKLGSEEASGARVKVATTVTSTESTKRPREDIGDDNPRQTKRPTPPPEEEKVTKPTAEGPSTSDKVSEPTSSPTESAKRPRDDADKDDNPRQAKRPTPPPDEDKVSPRSVVAKPEAAPSAKTVGLVAGYLN